MVTNSYLGLRRREAIYLLVHQLHKAIELVVEAGGLVVLMSILTSRTTPQRTLVRDRLCAMIRAEVGRVGVRVTLELVDLLEEIAGS